MCEDLPYDKTAKHISEEREDFIMLKQLSIYAENKKGVMQNITGILKNEDINILGSVTNDSAEYGIVRMVVSDPDKAKAALLAAGYLCHVIDVIGVEVEDKTGNLNDLLLTLKDSNVSVDYLYLSFNLDWKTDHGIPYRGHHGSKSLPEVQRIHSFIKAEFYPDSNVVPIGSILKSSIL